MLRWFIYSAIVGVSNLTVSVNHKFMEEKKKKKDSNFNVNLMNALLGIIELAGL